jgi:hypothetical protein
MDSSPDKMPSVNVNFRPVFHRCWSRYPASHLVDSYFDPYTKVTDSKAFPSLESNSHVSIFLIPDSPRRSARTQQWRRIAVKVLVVGGDRYCDWATAHNICACFTSTFKIAERFAAALCSWLQGPGRQGADRCDSYLAVIFFDAQRSTGSA